LATAGDDVSEGATQIRAAPAGPPPPATSSRARFLGLGAVLGAGALISACGGTSVNGAAEENTGSSPLGQADSGVVNYLLTLEYVLSDLYRNMLSSGTLNGDQLSLIELIANEEDQHIAALERAARHLGSVVQRPQTNFPLGNAHQSLQIAQQLEDTTADAYLGQLSQVVNVGVLRLLLTIHSVEGRHAAELNRQLGKPITPDGPLASALTQEDAMLQVNTYVTS
jgi:hypothetical protein